MPECTLCTYDGARLWRGSLEQFARDNDADPVALAERLARGPVRFGGGAAPITVLQFSAAAVDDAAGDKVAIYTVATNDGRYVHRWRVRFATVADEPYQPGGMLRVMRDRNGRVMAGPRVDQILTWSVEHDAV